jgi:hypothetical protein
VSPVANPIIQGVPGLGPLSAQAAGNSPPPPIAQEPTGISPGMLYGRGSFSDVDNTSVQVAVLVTAAAIVIVLLHIGGFRFAVDAGVTKL